MEPTLARRRRLGRTSETLGMSLCNVQKSVFLDVSMDGQTDNRAPIDRTRLCKVADVSRGKHIRWTQLKLLSAKDEYGELDLIRAAILDELHVVLKPSVAKTAWLQIAGDIDVLKPRLQILVAPATERAHAIYGSQELDEILPRNEPVIVVALEERIDKVRERLREFRSSIGEQVIAPGVSLHLVPRESSGGNAL